MRLRRIEDHRVSDLVETAAPTFMYDDGQEVGISASRIAYSFASAFVLASFVAAGVASAAATSTLSEFEILPAVVPLPFAAGITAVHTRALVRVGVAPRGGACS